ncbi:MAG: hypothetical protein GX893_06005 [Firmicutes bacterium]|nr:hypothetical protein [Bacillota bacterium]
MDVKQLKEYRTKLYTDLYTNVIPDRVPVSDAFAIEFFLQYAGKDLMISQYSLSVELLEEVLDKAMEFAKGDTMSLGAARNAVGIMFQKSRVNVMSKTGFIQHPEVSILSADEYDEYISNPHEYTLSVLQPRANRGWDADPVIRCMNFAKFMLSQLEHNRMIAEANRKHAEKYGLYITPPGVTGRMPIPFDTLADMNRGFTEIVKDIKRRPQKVLDALEALMPYCIWQASKSKAHPLGSNTVMTHMGAFLRTKEFEKFYWPTFEKLVHITAQRGQQTTIFCEHDWTRFVDYLQDLPQGTRIFMEYGDPQVFKDKLGKKLVLGGFYPIALLKSGTKQQCIDKAKELLDILAPGGNYYFCFDKSALQLSDINVENYVAVMEFVLENYKYENAGEKVSSVKKEDTIRDYSNQYPEFKSKYIIDFDDFIADYPPADEKAIPFMRAAYEKYSAIVDPFFS